MNFGIKLPFDKGIIYADIKSAKMIIYDTARMYNKNPYMLCLGAYHAGQAVEKTLKYVLAMPNIFTGYIGLPLALTQYCGLTAIMIISTIGKNSP